MGEGTEPLPHAVGKRAHAVETSTKRFTSRTELQARSPPGTPLFVSHFFASTDSAAVVIASTAVAITASASGAQKGLWIDGSLVMSPFAAVH